MIGELKKNNSDICADGRITYSCYCDVAGLHPITFWEQAASGVMAAIVFGAAFWFMASAFNVNVASYGGK